ncbi:MAG: hypothetical protein HY748_16465 [Elusimicrobia bacterium]|nr:hypothetical protein [Elusimicrobiota bacterium]
MSKTKKTAKKPAAAGSAVKPQIAAAGQAQEKPMLRAIRVTPQVLEAAKACKKATGKNFYALGLEAISERLVREGFLKAGEAGARS